MPRTILVAHLNVLGRGLLGRVDVAGALSSKGMIVFVDANDSVGALLWGKPVDTTGIMGEVGTLLLRTVRPGPLVSSVPGPMHMQVTIVCHTMRAVGVRSVVDVVLVRLIVWSWFMEREITHRTKPANFLRVSLFLAFCMTL